VAGFVLGNTPLVTIYQLSDRWYEKCDNMGWLDKRDIDHSFPDFFS
jgi:hypothetical protein